ncbi:hypothetical protein V500_00817 [Pseudogymnoascus sp. VKM F-4518 (FW-2643)]|nr:hypothetical protein V500_00817 [Pseudogymnoascus sp. VKM F-4518 (FW-2643)]
MADLITSTGANGQPTLATDTTARQEAISSTTQRPASSQTGPPGSRQSRDNSNAEGGSATGYTTLANRLRSASRTFESSSIPVGMCDATGSLVSSAPSLVDIRRGSYGSDGWSSEGQLKEKGRRASIMRRNSLAASKNSTLSGVPENQKLEGTTEDVSARSKLPVITPEEHADARHSTVENNADSISPAMDVAAETSQQYRTEPFENGYEFPPKHTWQESTAIGLKAFWKFSLTPIGFLVVIYGLNVVAWGGMLFLLLVNAAPAMCHPTCDDINSGRRVWIEINSQILNALFCVTGFGLVPWRFRDLYYLLKYRFRGDELSLRRLGGIHRGWFRLPGSSELRATIGPDNIDAEFSTPPPKAVPYPLVSIPSAPLTGIRAPATPLWKLDFVIWMYVWNTFFQCVLSGFMWGLNRYRRPSWSTGLFVALACIVAGIGGIMVFLEGKKVKGVEGMEVSAEDQQRLKRDREMGIVHFNNLKGEAPKPKKDHNSLFHKSPKEKRTMS